MDVYMFLYIHIYIGIAVAFAIADVSFLVLAIFCQWLCRARPREFHMETNPHGETDLETGLCSIWQGVFCEKRISRPWEDMGEDDDETQTDDDEGGGDTHKY